MTTLVAHQAPDRVKDFGFDWIGGIDVSHTQATLLEQQTEFEHERITSAGDESNREHLDDRPERGQAPSSALMELRRLSGLNWQQLADLFDVTRRSVHNWASGKPMAQVHADHLFRLLAVMRDVDRGSASENRRLLRTDADGSIIVDWLKDKRYKDVQERLGPGGVVRRRPKPVSPEALAERRPRLRPWELLGARQDPIHDPVSSGDED